MSVPDFDLHASVGAKRHRWHLHAPTGMSSPAPGDDDDDDAAAVAIISGQPLVSGHHLCRVKGEGT